VYCGFGGNNSFPHSGHLSSGMVFTSPHSNILWLSSENRLQLTLTLVQGCFPVFTSGINNSALELPSTQLGYFSFHLKKVRRVQGTVKRTELLSACKCFQRINITLFLLTFFIQFIGIYCHQGDGASGDHFFMGIPDIKDSGLGYYNLFSLTYDF
jgi:hypothetical protein